MKTLNTDEILNHFEQSEKQQQPTVAPRSPLPTPCPHDNSEHGDYRLGRCTHPNCHKAHDGVYRWWSMQDHKWKSPCGRCGGKGFITATDCGRGRKYLSETFVQERAQVRAIQAANPTVNVKPKFKTFRDYTDLDMY